MKETKYKAINYYRLSDADEKPGESNSISNQRRFINDFLKKHPDIEVVGEKIDDGISGVRFDRPALLEMRKDLEEGRANCCITKDLSRLGREFANTLIYLRKFFPENKIRFIAINDNLDTLVNDVDDIIYAIKGAFNDEYSRDISRKTRSALSAKRASGEYVGSCPVYGYRKDENNHNKLVIDNNPNCIREQDAECLTSPADIIRDIYRMKIDGLSAARIAEILNSQNVLSPHEYKKANGLPHPRKGFTDKDDAKWSALKILHILQDETYTGTLVQGITGTANHKVKKVVTKPVEEWKRFERAHEAIISKHNFTLVQRVLLLDTRTPPGGDSVYVFSGLLICDCCKGRMHRKTKQNKNKKTYYYYCRTSKKIGCDGDFMIREDELTESVFCDIKKRIANLASIDKIMEKHDSERIARGFANNLMSELNDNEEKLKSKRKHIAELSSLLVSGKMTKPQYKTIKAKLVNDEKGLALENKRLKHEVEEALSSDEERLAWIKVLKDFDGLETLDRRTVVNFINSITVKGKHEIEIEWTYETEYKTVQDIINAD